MQTSHDNIKITSQELANIWNSYIFETLVHHIFSYFLQHIDDPDIKQYVLFCQEKSKKHVLEYISLFESENIAIPRGTTSEDINLNAPRLFSDVFYINYIKSMSTFALMQFSIAYTEASRQDIRDLFLNHLHLLIEVDQLGTEIMLSKGLLFRSPSIPNPNHVAFAKKSSPLNGFFSTKRPLSVLEIGKLFSNSRNNAFGKALMMGFSQVTKSEELRKQYLHGKKLSNRFYQMFSEVLNEDDITTPRTFDSEVLATTESPFSERLMLNHVAYLNAFGFSTYGSSLSQSHRSDLILMYTRVLAEVASYGNELSQLLIKCGWMEEPPLAPDRNDLAGS